MEQIGDLLDGYRQRLTALGRPAAGLLLPGVQLDALPEPILTWFDWAGGTRPTADDPSFIPGQTFPTPTQAAELRTAHGPIEGYREWLPILVGGSEDFQAAGWNEDGKVGVVGVVAGKELALDYVSIEEMLVTYTAAIDHGAFHIDPLQRFTISPTRFEAVYTKVTGRTLT